ncbi:MAG: hypothetical protein FWD33_01380 [Alphaproteobacteria bacterium]|nr:hypothetical protein [Alphaproteobacteria bacterium]
MRKFIAPIFFILSFSAYAAEQSEEALARAARNDRMRQGAGIAAAGVGGMQLGQGLAENQAQAAGQQRMQNYLDTWQCGVGRVDGTTGRIDWSPGTTQVRAGQVWSSPEAHSVLTRDLARMRREFEEKQNQIRMAKGELDMELSEEELHTFVRHNLYATSDDVAAVENMNQVTTGGGDNRIAIGAGLAGTGLMLAGGAKTGTAIGTGLLAGGAVAAYQGHQNEDAGRMAIGGAAAVAGAGTILVDQSGGLGNIMNRGGSGGASGGSGAAGIGNLPGIMGN